MPTTVRDCEPGRRIRDGSSLAGRLAPTRREPVRRGPRRWPRRTRRAALAPLADHPRAALPRPSPVTGPSRRSRGLPRGALRARPESPVRGHGRAGSPTPARGIRASPARERRRRHARVQSRRPDRDPVRGRPADAGRLLDVGLHGRPLHPVPRRDQRHGDLRRRALPRRWRQERRSRWRSGRRARSRSTSTSPTSPRARSTRAGRARWRRPRTG